MARTPWRLVVAALLLLTPGSVDADPAPVFASLRAPTTPEQTAWGGPMAAGGSGPDALRQNPAGLAGAQPFQLAASHRAWQFGMQQEWMGARFPVGPVWLGLDAAAVHAGSLQGFDDLGNPTGEFHPLDLSVGLGIAGAILRSLRGGIAVQCLYLSGSSRALRGWSADCGLAVPVGQHELGLVARHLGPPIQGELGVYELPAEIAVGGTHPVARGLETSWTAALGLDDSAALRGGVRWRPAPALAVLLGGRWSPTDERFQPGAGAEVDWAALRVSYGFLPDGETGSTHHLAIALRSGVSGEPSSRRPAETIPIPPAGANEVAPVVEIPGAPSSETVDTWSVWGGTHRTRSSAGAEVRAWEASGVKGAVPVSLPNGDFRVRLRASLTRDEAQRLARLWAAEAVSDQP